MSRQLMEISITDPNANSTMNIFLVIANFLNLIYNLPQMLQTYRTKSTDDINQWFVILRIASNGIWMVYGIYINSFLMVLNNAITVGSSIFIGYYKYHNYLLKKKQTTAPTPEHIV
jgi:uncharacterized protein with PQ loop repeat